MRNFLEKLKDEIILLIFISLFLGIVGFIVYMVILFGHKWYFWIILLFISLCCRAYINTVKEEVEYETYDDEEEFLENN